MVMKPYANCCHLIKNLKFKLVYGYYAGMQAQKTSIQSAHKRVEYSMEEIGLFFL